MKIIVYGILNSLACLSIFEIGDRIGIFGSQQEYVLFFLIILVVATLIPLNFQILEELTIIDTVKSSMIFILSFFVGIIPSTILTALIRNTLVTLLIPLKSSGNDLGGAIMVVLVIFTYTVGVIMSIITLLGFKIYKNYSNVKRNKV